MQELTFETILRLPQMELKKRLKAELKSRGYPVTDKPGYLYAEGTIPVLLVAHMDTVHRQPVEQICYSADRAVAMSPQGIGGDDRCGRKRNRNRQLGNPRGQHARHAGGLGLHHGHRQALRKRGEHERIEGLQHVGHAIGDSEEHHIAFKAGILDRLADTALERTSTHQQQLGIGNAPFHFGERLDEAPHG